MAKESIYNRGSVKEGENEVVCQSRFHAPSHVRNGSYIRFYGDGAMYQIGKVEPFFCILNFRKELSSRVFIEDENAITIVAGDMMEISYIGHLRAFIASKHLTKNIFVYKFISYALK